MRLLDLRPADDRAVLEHILEVHEVAVVHMLGKIVRVMEMDDARFVRLHDVGREQDTVGQIPADLARHVVALDGVDGRVLVRVLLLDLFIITFNQRENPVVGRVLFTGERADITVLDIVPRHIERTVPHDLPLDGVLDLLHAERAPHALPEVTHIALDLEDGFFREAVCLRDGLVGFSDGGADFRPVIGGLRAAAFDDIHMFSPWCCQA